MEGGRASLAKGARHVDADPAQAPHSREAAGALGARFAGLCVESRLPVIERIAKRPI